MPLLSVLLLIGWVLGLLLQTYTPLLWIIVVVTVFVVRKQYHISLLAGCLMSVFGMLRIEAHTQITPPTEMVMRSIPVIVTHQSSDWEQQLVIVRDNEHRFYRVILPVHPPYYRGSSLNITGSFKRWPVPLSDFHHRLQQQRIIGEIRGATVDHVQQNITMIAYLEKPRQYYLYQIYRAFPEPMSAVVSGMLLGIAGDVDESTADAFRRSGTSHILVISGWNITIVAALCQIAIQRLRPSRLLSLLLPLIVLGMYVLFTGATPAVVRAGVMGGIIVIGKWLDRPRAMFNVIALAVVMITCVDPSTLWDMGMQLSTLATVGLIGFSAPLEQLLKSTLLRSKSLAWVRESLSSTIAAQITTFPIMLCRLELPSWWSLLANIIITPVVPLAMACGTVFLLATLIHPLCATASAWIAYPSFAWIIVGSTVIASWPSTRIFTTPSQNTLLECVLHGCWLTGLLLLNTYSWQSEKITHTP